MEDARCETPRQPAVPVYNLASSNILSPKDFLKKRYCFIKEKHVYLI